MLPVEFMKVHAYDYSLWITTAIINTLSPLFTPKVLARVIFHWFEHPVGSVL